MFLETLRKNNPALLEYAFSAQQSGEVLPDTYILDLDTILDNARKIKQVADEHNIRLYFMLKQIGRNPLVAAELQKMGYAGCVAVDYKEALVMKTNGIRLGNVGHLVQTPRAALKAIIAAKPEVMTVYTLDKIEEINEVAGQLSLVQPLLIRISDDDSLMYSGQQAGFPSSELKELVSRIEKMPNVKVAGLTVFPAFLYDAGKKAIEPTVNMKAMQRARTIMEELGYKDLLINMPSANCCASLPLVSQYGGNNAEPGHGLTGTTPLHKDTEQPEKVGYVYVSEVSHNFRGKGLVYGGGYYRRGHLEHALVGSSLKEAQEYSIKAPDLDSIDYHFELDHEAKVSDGVLMCFRTQIFTTRSHVAVVSGIQKGQPQIVGLYDSLGHPVQPVWRL